ncbi:TPA: hypothetical protein PC537_000030 [Morganella morganii]|nr:hypothetical protein [Morganella morganii]
MINLYKEYKPLKEMYIPAGWFVMKNNMYDIAPEVLKKLSPDDAFLLKDTFFKNDIFIARLELPLSTKDKVTSIISIYSRYNEKNKNNHFIYDVELSIVSKKQEINITKENVANNLTSVAHFASEYMVIYSQYIASDFNLIGDNNLKDVENYMDNIYNERKVIFNY